MIDYDELYRTGTAPWEIGRLQPAIAALLEHGVRGPRVLDLGCGTGDLAVILARRGYHVTGVDISPVAIEKARAKADGLTAKFEVQDATALTLPKAHYDTVFDCGLLHNLQRHGGLDAYLTQLPTLVEPGGFLYVLAISAAAGGDWGVTRELLTAWFAAPTWTNNSIKDVDVLATVGGERLTMPGFLLRTSRSAKPGS
ncbi:class I SAM-dependent methyltransferase [Actinoplanes awajinensis]|uniref:Methyltransferase n=1 Tax=Actinoplanes awajinensis subsp. mycoplanecinus TaxID=135947 RepID=A0A117MQW8_9ACTN|nr:class I SAM-dependent methyltransferase [Actinoplanes awajinensis]KUL30849.1 methyltransferase [Actinoplanes awajinensis subsp. mycoplanecinus]